jgi:hypothetical protein
MLRQGVACREALLSQHIDGVARAGSAGTKSRSRARFWVLLTMLAPVVENRTVLRDQLQLDDEANLHYPLSELANPADGGATGSRLPGGTSVGDLPTSSVSAVQLIPETMGSARTANTPLYSSIN